MTRIDLRGQKYGRLTPIKYDRTENKRAYWICKCDCGNLISVATNNLRNGHTKSCGCYAHEERVKNATKHEMTGTRLYRIWANMITRATNPKYIEADRYSGRGITVCDEWRNSSNVFFEWALNHGYSDDLSLDRIDNSKGYYPENCRFTDFKTQCRNRDSNLIIEFHGEKKPLIEWSEILGIDYKKLHNRIKKHKWDIERAFTTP